MKDCNRKANAINIINFLGELSPEKLESSLVWNESIVSNKAISILSDEHLPDATDINMLEYL